MLALGLESQKMLRLKLTRLETLTLLLLMLIAILLLGGCSGNPPVRPSKPPQNLQGLLQTCRPRIEMTPYHHLPTTLSATAGMVDAIWLKCSFPL